MLRVIINDFRMNAVWLLLLVAFLTLLLVLQWWAPGRGAFSALVAGTGIANLMMVVIFGRRIFYRVYLLERILPIDSSAIVAANYFMAAILFVSSAAFGLAFRDLLDQFAGTSANYYQLDRGYLAVHSFLVRIVSWWIVVAIAMPFILRYGDVLRIVVGYVVVGTLHSIAVYPLLHVSEAGAAMMGVNGWIAFVMTLLVITCILSFMISLEVFRRKEF